MSYKEGRTIPRGSPPANTGQLPNCLLKSRSHLQVTTNTPSK